MPQGQLASLRQAFDDTMQDPAFVKKMSELSLELLPRKAQEIETILIRAMTNRDAVVRNMKTKLNLN